MIVPQATGQFTSDGIQRFVPGQIIVKSRGQAMPAEAVGRMAALGLRVAPGARSGRDVVYQTGVGGASSRSAPRDRAREAALRNLVTELNNRSDIEYAQLNWIVRPTQVVPDDPCYERHWHYFTNGTGQGESLGGINLPVAWTGGTGSEQVVVAVLDTGVLANHPDIARPGTPDGFDMITDAATANDGDGRDADPTDPGDACGGPDSWHGTHVSSTVGAVSSNNGAGMTGINWQVKILHVRVLGVCGGSISDINDGIRWAADISVPGIPDNSNPAAVINLSLGGALPCSASPATQAAIDDARARGTSVVVSAGNEATDAANSTPASCVGVITVAASDARGNLATRYSNFGSTVEIMAPGGDRAQDADQDGNPDGVLGAVRGGYAYYNGTSMAAPHVSGVAALLKAQRPSLSPDDVLGELQRNARPRTTAECPQPCGAGLLDAEFLGN